MLLQIIVPVALYTSAFGFEVMTADQLIVAVPPTKESRTNEGFSAREKVIRNEVYAESSLSFRNETGAKSRGNQLKEELGRTINHRDVINSIQNSDKKYATHPAKRKSRQVQLFPGSPIYDSLLTRRTFIPSFRMVLLELSLMTISVYVINALENMMAAQKKKSRKTVPSQDSRRIENHFHFI